MFYSVIKKRFSQFYGSIKHIDIKTNVCFDTNHMVFTVLDHHEETHIENEVRTKDPLEALIFSLNLCKVRTFEFHTKKQKVDKYIQSITFDTLAKYDGRCFTGLSTAPNRYQEINMDINVLLKKDVPLDIPEEEFKKKLLVISEACPVYNMLKLAGCPFNLKYILDKKI